MKRFLALAFTCALPLTSPADTKSGEQKEKVDAPWPSHYSKGRKTFDGTGKHYMGREISYVMGHQAIRWLDVRVTGRAGHAGTTPMPARRDALFGAAEIAQTIERRVAETDGLLATVGECHVEHGSRNTIAADLRFTLDLRHPDDAVVDAAIDDLRARFAAVAERRGVDCAVEPHWRSPALPFDETCVGHVREAARALDCRWQDMISGAGHDAFHLARHCPTAMIFIPCAGGLSHHEAESIEAEHARIGADVLANAALARAGRA